jgi:hypothetical protein
MQSANVMISKLGGLTTFELSLSFADYRRRDNAANAAGSRNG